MPDAKPGPYSLFAPKGLAQYRAGKPLAQALHETGLLLFSKHGAAQGGFNTDPGSLVDLFCFSLAITLARAARTLERADEERFAAKAYYLLAKLEEEHGLRPGADDRLHARHAALADAKRAPRGNARAELEQQLRDLLGDDFVGLHIPSGAEVVAWPEELGDQPQLLAEASIDRKLVQIVPAISTDLGTPQQVRYRQIDPADIDGEHTLTIGDRLVVEPENLGRAEVVTVEGLLITEGEVYFTATFNQAHEPNCWAAQMPFPAWTSTQRNVLVALPPDAVLDPEKRRKVDVLLTKILTGVTRWSLCGSSGAGTIGPWTIGDPQLGMIGFNPIGIISVP